MDSIRSDAEPDNSAGRRARVPLWMFFTLLFSISWIGAVPMIGSSRGWLPEGSPLQILQLLMFAGPLIAALICAGLNDGKAGVRRLLGRLLIFRTRPILYLVALLGPAVLCLTVLGLHALTGGETPTLAPSLLINAAMIFGVYLLLNTEEIAWRGYAQPRLQSRLGERKTALFLGVLWALFHVPLFLMADGHPAGYPLVPFLLMLVGMNVIFTRFYGLTGASLLLVHMLHQSFNAWAEALPFFPRVTGGPEPFYFAVGIIWVIAGAILLSKERSLPEGS